MSRANNLKPLRGMAMAAGYKSNWSNEIEGWLASLVKGGGHSGQVFEVFTEGALVREVQLVGNLLDVQAGEPEHVFCFEDDVVVNPLGGRASGSFLDHEREVFRGNEHFGGIEGDASVLAVVFRDEIAELDGILKLSRPRSFVVLDGCLSSCFHLHNLVAEGGDERSRDGTGVYGVVVNGVSIKKLEDRLGEFGFVGRESHCGAVIDADARDFADHIEVYISVFEELS